MKDDIRYVDRLREELLKAISRRRASRLSRVIEVFSSERRLVAATVGLLLAAAVLIPLTLLWPLKAPSVPKFTSSSIQVSLVKRVHLGGALFGVATTDDAVWVAQGVTGKRSNTISGFVVKLDRSTGQVAARIKVGNNPFYIATTPDAVWVVNHDDRSVSRIDPRTNRVIATITLARAPFGIAAGDGGVWVTGGDQVAGGFLYRIDAATNRVIATVPLRLVLSDVSVGDVAVGGGSIWVAQPTAEIARIDPTTNRVAGEVSVPGNGAGFSLSFGYGSLWVSDLHQDTMYRIDPYNQRVQAETHVSQAITSVSVGAGSIWVVRGTEPNSEVLALDPKTGKVVGRIALPSAFQLAVVGDSVWVTDLDGGVARLNVTRSS